MRKEVHAAYRRSIHHKAGKTLTPRGSGSIHPWLKLAALVCILGTSAYLLFTWETTETRKVRARQSSEAITASVPQSALHNQTLAPGIPTVDDPPKPIHTTKTASKLNLLSGLPAALEKATSKQAATAQAILNFADSRRMADIQDLSHDEILSLAELLTSELGTNAVADALESQLGLPAAHYLENPKPAEAIADLFEAIRAETHSADTRPVVFSDRVEPDGTVTGNVHVIPAGTKRVYAAFENQGAVQGLDRVLAVWRNPADDQMVFTEFEPVRTGTSYNYVWLELENGWPAGFYKLDLFHPRNTTQLLASRSFNVR